MFSKNLKEYRVAESDDKKKLHCKNETIEILNAAISLNFQINIIFNLVVHSFFFEIYFFNLFFEFKQSTCWL